jgi:hypothetical protein
MKALISQRDWPQRIGAFLSAATVTLLALSLVPFAASGDQHLGLIVSPRAIPGGIDASAPHVGVDRTGTATAVWSQSIAGGYPTVMVATHAARAARWSSPQMLSASGEFTAAPEIAVAASGAAVAVWQVDQSGAPHATGLGYITASLRAPRGHTWSTPTPVSPPGQEAVDPQAAIDNQGRATVIWRSDQGRSHYLDVSTWVPSSDAWSAPNALQGSARSIGTPAIATDPRGDTVIVWWNRTTNAPRDGLGGKLAATSRTATGTSWKPTAVLGAGIEAAGPPLGQPGPPSLAVDPRGRAIVAWKAIGSPESDIEVSTLTLSSGRWRRQPAVPSGPALSPQIAAGPLDESMVVWLTEGGLIRMAEKPIGGCCWAGFRTLASAPSILPQIAGDASGDIVITWQRNGTVEATTRGAHTLRWTQPRQLGGHADAPTPVMGADGGTVVIWQQFGVLTSPAERVNNFINSATLSPPFFQTGGPPR